MIGVGLVSVVAMTLAWQAPFELEDRVPMRSRVLAAFGDSKLAGVRLTDLPEATGSRSTVESRTVYREAQARSREHPTPRALGDYGISQLVTGDYDAAIRTLERASRQAPFDTVLRTDLDAAYLVRGRALNNPRDLVRALNRIGPNPSLPEPAFNRALALQSLFLRRLAKNAWMQYIRRDPDSSWGLLAAAHLPVLASTEGTMDRGGSVSLPIQSSRPEVLQDWIEEQGLTAWISAVFEGDETGRRTAELRLGAAASRLAELSGDRLATDEAQVLSAASGERLRMLAQGLRDYTEARRWLDRYSFERALELFRRSSVRLGKASSPRFWVAEEGIAHCDLQLERYAAARGRAEQTARVARRQRYSSVEARCSWILAGINLAILDLDSAQRHATALYDIHQRAKNRTGTATADLLLGRIDDEMGDSTAAWFHRLRGFRDLAQDGGDERLAMAISNASFALAREGELHAAADFASEALAFDRWQGTPLGLAESLWIRAMHRAKGGDPQGALADIREAESYLPKIDSPANRVRLLAGLRAVEGASYRVSRPLLAIEKLDEALEFLQARGYEYGQAEILIDRARSLGQISRFEEALANLDQAARLVAAQRIRIQEPLLRVSFFDLQAELADERVAASMRLDPLGEKAFWAADQARGLLFRDSLDLAPLDTEASPQSISRLTSHLGETDALLSYWSLPDSLLIWVARRDKPLRIVRRAISRAQLIQQTSSFVAAIEEGAEPSVLMPLSLRLGESLIAPLSSDLVGVSRLIVVPDRIVRGVPWAALEAGRGQGPLLRQFILRVSPAAGMLGTASGGRPHPADDPAPGHLLAIGDPEVISPAGNTYFSLPGARREIERIAGLFPEPVVLTGREATRDRLLAELGKASIVHVATHFLVGRNPGSSRIVLAGPAGDSSGSLDAAAIARLSLPHLRLVVLSGCATNREAEPSLEGTFAAAGSFLAAGAGEAVATLWPVGDRFTADLMTRFYRELLSGYDTDEALRRAQLALLDGVQPAQWAAFQVVSLRSQGRGTKIGRER
ncbi:MAG TPA: CHAT domain-containing protein [Thermoanaerobaculia bacterium]|nr:CHAT domain-containing protein [Thermoanaerobaculia bacterium]